MIIAIVGSSGLIGGYLLEVSLNEKMISKIILLNRKPIELFDLKIEERIIDFGIDEQIKNSLQEAEIIFCCVGTTIKKAITKEAFKKVDFDIPLTIARNANPKTRKMIVVSSVGASSNSNNFYLKTKGEMEDAVSKSFKGTSIFMRPSMLLGNRKESRTGEKIGIALSKLISPLLMRSLSKYKPIEAVQVAKSMLHESLNHQNIPNIYYYKQMI